jgi:hypothetical protein
MWGDEDDEIHPRGVAGGVCERKEKALNGNKAKGGRKISSFVLFYSSLARLAILSFQQSNLRNLSRPMRLLCVVTCMFHVGKP